jgi:hypothetical protein
LSSDFAGSACPFFFGLAFGSGAASAFGSADVWEPAPGTSMGSSGSSDVVSSTAPVGIST